MDMRLCYHKSKYPFDMNVHSYSIFYESTLNFVFWKFYNHVLYFSLQNILIAKMVYWNIFFRIRYNFGNNFHFVSFKTLRGDLYYIITYFILCIYSLFPSLLIDNWSSKVSQYFIAQNISLVCLVDIVFETVIRWNKSTNDFDFFVFKVA
jgi:hypothetical protein